MPLSDGNDFLNIGTKTSEVSSEKLALSPQDDPRNITTPIRKKTFRVPTELNLVKNVGDFKLITGNKNIKNKGAVLGVKMLEALSIPSSNVVSLLLKGG